MRTIIILILLVILLVAVSWFRPACCEPLDNDSLLKAYQLLSQKRALSPGDKNYTSPDFYDKTQPTTLPQVPVTEPGAIATHTIPAGTSESAEHPDTLEPFGYSLFNSSSELSSAPEVADAADYLLGPGDNVIIYLWGKVEKEYNLTVDRQGKIFIPKIGEIIAYGQTLSGFEQLVNRKFSAIYSDFKSSVTLGKIRSIRIYLTGEVQRPGAYTVSSLTTLFNALYLAGGPNRRGSMRNIQLVRSNNIEATLDLYQFLLKGDSKSDVRLSSGDAIFIPVCGPRVSITGEVKRPAVYELLGGECLSQFLELAGGPTAEAYLDRVMLERISPKDERQVFDLNMSPKNGKPLDDIELTDGDHLRVYSLYDMRRNVVFVAGMVKHAGESERNDSTTLRDLLVRGELLPENVYYERANLFRRYPDRRVEVIPVNLNDVLAGRTNMPLQDLDSLHVYSIDEVRRKKYVYIDGEVERPGEYLLYDKMNLADLVFLAGNLKKNAYQIGFELARTDSLGKVQLQYIDMGKSRMQDIFLQEDDRVFVRQIPDWFLHRMVTVDGEVEFPGQYALMSRNETLYDLLARAGGFTERAFAKGAIFQRHTIGKSLLRQNLPDIIANSQPVVEDSTGAVHPAEVVKVDLEKMNRIVIDVEKIIDSRGEKGNMTLQNGDYIFIPEIPSGISVMGAVGANGTIKFEPGKKVDYYVKRAGNFTSQAGKKATRLIKADGRVYSGGGTLGKKVEIGDAIVVPTEIRKEHDLLKTMSTTASIIGGILTSVFIIDRLR